MIGRRGKGTRIAPRRLCRWLRGRLDLTGLLGLHPEALDDLAWQAYRRFQAGRFEEAGRIYALMDLLQPPGLAGAVLGSGACRQALGDLTGAEEAYGKVLAAEPDHPHALANRAEVRLLTDRPEAARLDLAAALARIDRDGGPADLRLRVEGLGDRVEAGPGRPKPT